MKFTSVIIVLHSITSLMSCISTKRLTYLAYDENNQVDNLISFLKRQRPYRLEINDLLSIRLKALDQELTSMFTRLVIQKIRRQPQKKELILMGSL